ncbi:DUF2911 domain-containing protein [Niabella ginsengisoli]|uniref:DUF2911 domain-containing protein n=1 Tax=Niabella ginsengisoli TaxID=522298 RepID=A0ABS9SNE5_9BACT|nr:DUF2911 domain-containing protein [Niabella ginsengisoli]MCH5599908.1 DUF2911 domain-containing protein [Niabella ginsengisoli]
MHLFYKGFLAASLVVSILLGCKENKKGRDNNVNANRDSIVTEMTNQNQSVVEDNNLYADVDISPMDMSYFPAKYPQHKIADPGAAPPVMRVIYSRPHLQGRKLFEDVLKYGHTWRLGANEATELNIFQNVTIGGKSIPVGRYSLYAIPKAGYWTIAINNDLDLWGLKQDSTKDVVRVEVPVTYYNPVMEYFTIVFEKTDSGANLVMAWDDALAKLPIKI